MYIQTESGLRKATETFETILIDFYGEGLHETLTRAQEDTKDEEIDLTTFKTEQARVYWS